MNLESAGLAIGRVIAGVAIKKWTDQRGLTVGSGVSLIDLLTVSFRDQFHKRAIERQLEEIADQAARRLEAIYRSEITGLEPHERLAAIHLAVDVVGDAELTDAALFEIDVDAKKLANHLHRSSEQKVSRAALSEPGLQFYYLLLDDSSVALIEIVRNLPQFQGRALSDVLTRLTDTNRKLDEVLRVLPRLGYGVDNNFDTRYLAFCSDNYDELEVFGLDTRQFRLRSRVSVAYMTLTVRSHDESFSKQLRSEDLEGEEGFEGAYAVESALSLSRRTTIFGSAGSGKTTLLQWIAIQAARQSFTGPLSAWNGKTPFLLKLRGLKEGRLPSVDHLTEEIAPSLSSFRPPRWEHESFLTGNAILLLDGMDELPTAQRRGIRDWLRAFSISYPKAVIIVTARPAAVDVDWLSASGFASVQLEPMSVTDIAEFSRRWHQAVREAAEEGTLHLPCSPDDLPAYETSLARQLAARTHLAALATSPLLCAMLCALNLDRQRHLPPDRMQLYADAIRMLVERRDIEREIVQSYGVSSGVVLILLRRIAWRLTLAGRAELSEQLAESYVANTLQRLDELPVGASQVLRGLVERSGVLRSPAARRVDFVHRTFQEYLAAQEAVNEHYIDVLIQNCRRDGWREVIVLAAGHATQPLRRQLIEGIIETARTSARDSRRLKLLAAACLETAGQEVDESLRTQIHSAIDTLIPPKRMVEARSLAVAGAATLRRMPPTLANLSEAEAIASIQAVAYIGGDEALTLLGRYSADPRRRIQLQLASIWRYFDAEAFAVRVLEHAPLAGGRIIVTQVEHLRYLTRLQNLSSVAFDGSKGRPLSSLSDLGDIPHLTFLLANVEGAADIAHIAHQSDLKTLVVRSSGATRNVESVRALRRLVTLHVRDAPAVDVLEAIPPIGDSLEHLSIGDGTTVDELSPVLAAPNLETLDLWGFKRLRGIRALKSLSKLTSMTIADAPISRGAEALADACPGLSFLNVHRCRTLKRLDGLQALPLSYLWINGSDVTDLEPLADIPTLTDISITDASIRSISPLAQLERLKRLDVRGSIATLDISPLVAAGRRLEIWISPGQTVRGASEQAKGRIRIRTL